MVMAMGPCYYLEFLWSELENIRCGFNKGSYSCSRFAEGKVWRLDHLTARMCDFILLDYFLLGHMKAQVYAKKPQCLDYLEENTREEIQQSEIGAILYWWWIHNDVEC